LVYVCLLSATFSCSNDDTPAPIDVPTLQGTITFGDSRGALLEGLCGATYKEIVADYLTTYYNYYKITPENNSELCNTLVSLRLNTCLTHDAGVSDESQLPDIDYAQAFSNDLISHGMSRQQMDAWVHVLTTP
jgi:hypothetical protein